ncbi:hypothetical protein ACIQI8_00290 [Streptomyces sp. NPDC092369]
MGALAMGMPPGLLRPWRTAIADGTPFGDQDLPGATARLPA